MHQDPRRAYRWKVLVTLGLVLSTLVSFHPATGPFAALAGMAVNLLWLWE